MKEKQIKFPQFKNKIGIKEEFISNLNKSQFPIFNNNNQHQQHQQQQIIFISSSNKEYIIENEEFYSLQSNSKLISPILNIN
jgi:hypothetical protein